MTAINSKYGERHFHVNGDGPRMVVHPYAIARGVQRLGEVPGMSSMLLFFTRRLPEWA
jgi:hypothetical protein